VRELRSDPWERATADIRIIAQPQPDPFAPERYFFIATWLPFVVAYFARDYGTDDGPQQYNGEIRVLRCSE
jgi:hypothetical protein